MSRHSPPTARRRFVFFVGLAVALGLGFLEGLARVALGPQDLVLNQDLAFLQDDAQLLWSLRPNLNAQMAEGWTLRTNSLGLRDDEVVSPKPASMVRVLSLGESTAWGYGVNAEQTYAELLQGWLAGPRGPRRQGGGYDVVNAGVGAYSVWQSSEYLVERGLALEPDIVLIYHLANDYLPSGILDSRNFLYQVTDTDRGLIEKRRIVAPLLSLLYKSHFYLGMRTKLMRPPSAQDAGPVRPAEGSGVRVPDEDRVFALNRILQTCQSVGARLVVIVPTYGGNRYGDDTVLRSFATRNGLSYVDLPMLRSRAGIADNNFFLPDGVHPQARGHQFIAEALARELNRLGI